MVVRTIDAFSIRVLILQVTAWEPRHTKTVIDSLHRPVLMLALRPRPLGTIIAATEQVTVSVCSPVKDEQIVTGFNFELPMTLSIDLSLPVGVVWARD